MATHPSILFQLGASHHTAPLAVREKLAIDAARASDLATRLGQITGVREFALVNTCNRVELYGVASTADAFPALHAALGAVTGCTPAELDSAVTLAPKSRGYRTSLCSRLGPRLTNRGRNRNSRSS